MGLSALGPQMLSLFTIRYGSTLVFSWKMLSLGIFHWFYSYAFWTFQKKQDGNPLTVLCHHKSKVNSVKWLRKPDGTSTEFVSCSADKNVAIWTLLNGSWQVTSVLKGHENGVTCIHGIYTNGDNLAIYSGSIDSTVKVWERCDGKWNIKHTNIF